MPIDDLLADLNTPESLQALEEALAQEDLTLTEFSSVLDGLQHVARDANVKMIVGALKALRSLVTASPEHLGDRQMATVCNITIDKIGDMKIQVRDSACQVLQTLLRVLTVPAMLERLDPAFNHRNHKVRQSASELISAHLQQHGLADMSSQDINKDLLPRLVSALSDSQLPVRSASQDALAVLYSFMGEELQALLKRHSIRPAQMRELQTRFEKAGSGMMQSESSHVQSQTQPLPTRPKSAGPPRKSVPSSRIASAPNYSLDTESVQAANIRSEAELTSEINNISRELGPKVDWERRIAALQKLQSVAMGAGAFPNFPDLIRLNLREQLNTQIQDRRSQVGRATCAALQACCETSGQRFEPLAIGLLPELFKLLVIAIVVVAEEAHACMTTIVQLCHSSRMLKGIVEALLRDKSPRLRQRCAEYLHIMLQHWPHTVLSRDVTLISSGVTKAVQDASPEARQVGREMFLTFAQQFPESVNGVLKNVEHSLAIKLRRQVATSTTANSSPAASPNGSFTTRRPSTAPGGASAATVPGPVRSVRLGASAGSVARRPNKLHTAPPSEHGRSRPPSLSPKPAAAKSRSSVGGSRLFSESSTLSNNSTSSNVLSLEGALAKYKEAKNSHETLAWSTAVSLCEGVMHALERAAVSGSDCRSLLRPHMSSLKVMIKDGLERNHLKVQTASLELFNEAFLACPILFEEPLMELLPPTLVLCNARNQQAQTKAVALRNELGRHLPAASLCPAIVHSIRSAKLWYVKTSAYDLFVDHIGLSQPAGVPTDNRIIYAVAVEAVEHVTNSMPEMRQSASQALAAVYTFSPESVVKAVCALNSANAKRDITVQAVQDAIPGFQQDLQAHLFNHNSPERQNSRSSSAHDGTKGPSPRGTSTGPSPRANSGGTTQRSMSRDENSAPNRHSVLDSKVAHVEAVSRVVYGATDDAATNGGGGAAARGVSTMTMSDIERIKVTSERIDRLLSSINNNPRNCGPALIQLKTAVRAVPEEVWQVKVQIVVSTAMKLLLLTYYEVLEDVCRMLAELVKVRPALLQQILQPLADCLLDVYNGLPADRQPDLLKHIERTLDMMALHLDVHTLMQGCYTVQYYIEKFPSPTSKAKGTATSSVNCLRKLAVMARFTIMRCKNNVEHENDLLSLLPSLHTTMDTDCAAVRMRTTEMWVAAFSVLGSRLQPYMESLSTTQKRIVNLYISRMKPAELTQPEVEQSEVAVAN